MNVQVHSSIDTVRTMSRLLCGSVLPLLLALASVPGMAQSRTVGPNGNCDFSSLQGALEAATSGQAISELRLSGPHTLYQGQTYELDMAELTLTSIAQHFRIIGGFPDCDSVDPEADPTQLGAQSAGRVFDIHYDVEDEDLTRTVTLRNLIVTNGLADDGSGGGIRIAGHSGRQRVILRNVQVATNQTSGTGNHGGGVELLATASAIEDHPLGEQIWFVLDNDSTISENSAPDGFGGGLHCLFSGSRRPGDEETGTILIGGNIVNNVAMGGGGIAAGNCNIRLYGNVEENLATSDHAGSPFDFAGNGGGIFLIDPGHLEVSSGRESVFGIQVGNQATQTRVANNVADDLGGGIYVGRPQSSTQEVGSHAELIDVDVVGNHAGFAGGGIYVDVRGSLHMGLGEESSCAGTGPCSRLRNNEAEGDGGGALGIRNGTAEVYQTYIHGNSGENLASTILIGGIVESAPHATLELEGTAIFDNHGAEDLIHLIGDASLLLAWSTVAANHYQPEDNLNVFQLTPIDSNQPTVEAFGTILHEPSLVSGTGFARAVCVISTVDILDSGFIPHISPHYSSIDPHLVDAAAGNLRLKPDSPSIDYCGRESTDYLRPEHNDILNRPRGVPFDLETVDAPNPGIGFHDLGALELQPDALFNDRFNHANPQDQD